MKSLYSLMLVFVLSLGLQAQFVTSATSVPTPTANTVAWNSCAPASGVVKYGTTTSYGSTASDPTLAAAHSVQLTGLLPQTTYHFATVSIDSTGAAVQSADQVFTTLAGPPPPAPAISSQPANPTTLNTAVFNFSDTQAGVGFQCALDGAAFSSCTSGVSYSALTNASHTFSVLAKDPVSTLVSTATSYTWVVNVVAPPPPTVVSLWTTQVPVIKDGGADSAVELGIKASTDVAGQITAIKFYKSAANTGTHVANIWSSTGTKLGTVTFTGETTSGWQRQALATPISITAGQTFVVSYHSTIGHYAADTTFTGAYNNVPLHVAINGGVFAYGSSSLFPTSTFKGSNYWVDFELTTNTVVIPPCNPPNTIVNGVCTPPTQTSHTVTVTWDSSVTPGVVYDLYRAPSGGSYTLVASSISGNTYTDTTVINGQTYDYVGTSVNSVGESVVSNVSTVVIPVN